jgi:RsiW-degrading membrane proteinase PrsW (M82 family)
VKLLVALWWQRQLLLWLLILLIVLVFFIRASPFRISMFLLLRLFLSALLSLLQRQCFAGQPQDMTSSRQWRRCVGGRG